MEVTEQMRKAKLKEIKAFEKKYGADHGIRSVYAMKKYCTDSRYRELVHQFTDACANTYKAYRFKTPYNDWD